MFWSDTSYEGSAPTASHGPQVTVPQSQSYSLTICVEATL